jgi:hypothetical protein
VWLEILQYETIFQFSTKSEMAAVTISQTSFFKWLTGGLYGFVKWLTENKWFQKWLAKNKWF